MKQHTWTSRDSGIRCDRPEDLQDIYDWTQPTIALLNDLDYDFSSSLLAWETFRSNSGDIGYFLDSPSSSAPIHDYGSLRAIKETFEKLALLQRKLVKLKTSSQQRADDVSFLYSYLVKGHLAETFPYSYTFGCNFEPIKLRRTARKPHSAAWKQLKRTPSKQCIQIISHNLRFWSVHAN